MAAGILPPLPPSSLRRRDDGYRCRRLPASPVTSPKLLPTAQVVGDSQKGEGALSRVRTIFRRCPHARKVSGRRPVAFGRRSGLSCVSPCPPPKTEPLTTSSPSRTVQTRGVVPSSDDKYRRLFCLRFCRLFFRLTSARHGGARGGYRTRSYVHRGWRRRVNR